MAQFTAHQLIDGRYEIRRTIGVGGMGQVYLAHDQRLGRDVAIKVVQQDGGNDPQFVERFRREARAAARLNHPNVVAVYDWGPADGAYYMVMEYVDGPNLKELLLRRGAFPERDAVGIAEQVAAALGHAHEHGVIHRDVKPANILIGPDNRVKVADFGIARAVGLTQLTATNMLTGTAHYMSPEQAQLKPLDGRSDLYSLGVVLYEMLTDSTPFSGESMVEIALQHVHGEAPPLRQLRPDVSPATEAVVNRALQKDPADRFQSAGDMHAALQRACRALAEKPAPAPVSPSTRRLDAPAALPTMRPQPVNRRRSRRGWLASLGALLVFAGAGIGINLARSPGHPFTAPPSPTLHTVHHAAGTPTGHHPSPQPTQPAQPSPSPAPAAKRTPPAKPATGPTPAGALDPVSTVQMFYTFIVFQQFDKAAQLWSPRLRAQDPPEQYINERFAQIQELDPHAKLTSLGPDTAVVSVDVKETDTNLDPPPPTTHQHFRGHWYLIKVGGRWLMDSEDLSSTGD